MLGITTGKAMIKKLLAGLLVTGLLASFIIPTIQVSAAPETETLRPDAAGDENAIAEQIPADSFPATDHWNKVDETPSDEDTTLVRTDTAAAERDLYNVENHSVGSGTVNHVTVYARFKRAVGGTFYGFQVSIKGGEGSNPPSVLWESPPIGDVGTTWDTFSYEWGVNPATSAAWTWDEIDNMQIGIRILGDGGYAYCTQVYVEVDYTLPPPDPPTNFVASDNLTDRVTCTWTKSDGATKYQLYRDGAPIGAELGDVNTTDDATAAAGTVTPGTASASDGTYAAYVELSLAGEGVNDGTVYSYKVRAGNAAGWSGDSNLDNGNRRPSAITYQWWRSSADADEDYNSIVGATTDPYNDTDAPANGDGRWYYCVVNATGAAAPQISTHDRGFRAVAPTVTTVVCSGFNTDWAIVNGIVDDVGLPASVTQIRFVYGLTTGYGDTETKTVDIGTGDEFWIRLTGLDAGSVYHYRAEAYNGVWGNGSDGVFSTEGSDTLYEYVNTGGTVDGDDCFEGNWSAQQFTVLTVAHSLDFANLYVKRTGSPGDAVLSIRHADGADKPTGTDLDSVTLDADGFSAALDWVRFDFPDDITLEAGESYALVLRCPQGGVADYLEWREAAGSVLADAVASYSIDSGISWTVEGAGADFLFEVWGEPVFEVLGAQVFTGYLETGDWLIVLTYRNYFTPYYPDESCPANFYLRLIDDTTMIAQVNCPAYRYRPASFYFSKALADTMEWGVTDFKIRLYGITADSYTEYNIAAADWRGADLEFLDSWVIQQANIIGDDIGLNLTTTVTDKGEILNAFGRNMFVKGIPDLDKIRLNLFAYALQQAEYEESTYTGAQQTATDWEARVGPTVATMLNSGGSLLGITGDQVGMMIAVIMMLLLVGVLAMKGHLTIGIMLAFVPLLLATWLGFISYIILGVIVGSLGVVVFAYKLWLARG